MFKRFISIALCVMLTLGAASSVFAAGSAFSDVKDPAVAKDTEILRLMGVIEGYEDGTFKPAGNLTRAQFCKMAVCMLGIEQEATKYSNITIFPDVKPSHWASSYINLAAKGRSIIAGYDDGTFRPNQPITSGQAVTIILRIMGYKDEFVGGIWPDSFMAVGDSIGLLEGCGFTGGRQTINRAQAARLFVNMMTCDTYEGGKVFSLSDEVIFKSYSADTNKMVCRGEDKVDVKYDMVNNIKDSMFVGMTGRMVLNGKGKVLSFIPSDNSTGIYDGIVIASADGSTTGFTQIAGGTDYRVFRNGEPAEASDIKKWDVATYNPGTRSMRLCSTRLKVRYEDCSGSPKSPDTITILGGMSFPVMENAKPDLAKFRPGDTMVVLFTIDGQVAGAIDPSVDSAVYRTTGEVDKNGKLTVDFCGDKLEIPGSIEKKYWSYQVIMISYMLDGPRVTYLSEPETTGRVYYAKITISGDNENPTVVFDCGPDKSFIFYRLGVFSNHQRVAVMISDSEEAFSWVDPMKKLEGVKHSSWLGKEAVTYGSSTYVIDENTVFYNLDAETWSNMDKCLEYAEKSDMYVYDGVVRIVEFSAR